MTPLRRVIIIGCVMYFSFIGLYTMYYLYKIDQRIRYQREKLRRFIQEDDEN
jgi:hypothetical protein